MKYIVQSVEAAITASRKPYKKVTLSNGTRFNYWNNAEGYDAIEAGVEIEGQLSRKGKYWEFTPMRSFEEDGGSIKIPNTGSAPDFGRVMRDKADMIAGAQQSKGEGIKISSTARDATLIITSFYAREISEMPSDMKEAKIKEKWNEWRAWLLENFDQTPAVPF